jgi:hypothetical protein
MNKETALHPYPIFYPIGYFRAVSEVLPICNAPHFEEFDIKYTI